MRGMVDWLATWPGGAVPVPPPPVWLIVVFYALLVPALIPLLGAGTRWLVWIGRVAVALLILWLPFQREVDRSLASGGEVKVTLLAVGAGQCAVVQPPSGRTVLIDAGSTSLVDVMGKCLGPYLRHSRCTQIDTVMISHANLDHFSGVSELAEAYGVREVLTGAHFKRFSFGNPPAEEMLSALDRMERPPRRLSPGDHTPLGADTEIEVLWPPPDQRYAYHFSVNDVSLVLKLTHAGKSILFPGDIQDPAMKELLKKPERLKADVLIAPHHGSGEGFTEQFVNAVDPRWIVSSNDRTLTNKQRAFETMIGGRPLYRTNTCGSVTVTITREGEVRVEPFWDVPPVRGRP
jgi:competence protein ComEC